ncbi:hypothetical protein BU17DRAFT_89405 [Hysterangium stoloniferum]|nr:hypothetical protein BU17DRAFT_89405 [Hysterangium stoloniferum]
MTTRHYYPDGNQTSNFQHGQSDHQFMDWEPTYHHAGSFEDVDHQQRSVYQNSLHQGLEDPSSHIRMQRTAPSSPSLSPQHTTPGIARGPPQARRPLAVQADQNLYRYITGQNDNDSSRRHSTDLSNLHQWGANAAVPQTSSRSIPAQSPYSFTIQTSHGPNNNNPFAGMFSASSSSTPVALPSSSSQINNHDQSYICRRGTCGPFGVPVQKKNREHHDRMHHQEGSQTSPVSDFEGRGSSTKRRRQI